MRILSIETSCDETAVSVVEAKGGLEEPCFEVLGNALFSQIDLHKEYGGVYPNLAKREHAKNLPPLLLSAIANVPKFEMTISEDRWQKAREIVSREQGLYEAMRETFPSSRPDVDLIAVTAGPGLEPALWVGISFAEALGVLWDIPVRPVNHMEGHIASVLLQTSIGGPTFANTGSGGNEKKSRVVRFPAVALLVSGGHTELVRIAGWGQYEILGQTRDDAVGEAFDKVARMLSLSYPGGPEVSRLAAEARREKLPRKAQFPRPMIHSGDLDFSFSGLKTSVLYYIRDYTANKGEVVEEDKRDIALNSTKAKSGDPWQDFAKDVAREFEDSVIDVLISKTSEALDQTNAASLIVAGGVVANSELRHALGNLAAARGNTELLMPERNLATDNSVMIACAAYIEALLAPNLPVEKTQEKIIARGNLRLG